MFMHQMPFDMYCLGRAEMFAGSASDASFLIDGRDAQRVFVVRVFLYESDCSDRAMACTVAAFDLISIDNAELEPDHCMAYLNGRFFFGIYRSDSSGRTDL